MLNGCVSNMEIECLGKVHGKGTELAHGYDSLIA